MLRKGMKVLFIITSLLLIPMQGIVHAEEGTEPQPTETTNTTTADCPQEEEKEPVITVEPKASSDSNTEAPAAYDMNPEPVKLENAELQSAQTFNAVNNPALTLHTIEWGSLEHGSIRIIAGSDELLSGYDELTAGTEMEVHLYPEQGYRYKEGSLEEKTTPAIEFTRGAQTRYEFIMPDADVTLGLEFELIPVYDQQNVDAINAVIQARPESFNQDMIDHPEQWDFAKWELFWNNTLEITGLDLSNKNLQGTLDVSDLTSLETLSCANNSLTELLFYDGVVKLDCSQNQLKTLTIYDYALVNCEGNPMEKLRINNNDWKLFTLSVTVSNEDEQAGNTAYIQSFNGSVTSTPTYTLKAFPAKDYQFTGWTIDTLTYIDSTLTLGWMGYGTTVQANFKNPIQILLPPDEIVLKKGQTLHIIPTVLPENASDKEVSFGVVGGSKFDLRKDTDNPNAFYLEGKEVGKKDFALNVGNGSKLITVKVIDRDFIQPAITENTIGGVNGSYNMKSTLSFTAAGAGLDNPEPLWEDWRWVPVRWYIDNQNVDAIQGTFSSGNDQSASLTGLPAGNHELIVEFQKEVYNNWNWEPAETERLSTVFSVTSPIPNPTVTPTPKPSEPEANLQSVTVPSSPWIIKKTKTTVKATATPEPTNTPELTETPTPTETPVTPAPESSTAPIPSEVKKSGLPGWTAAAVISAAVIVAGGVLLLKRRLK